MRINANTAIASSRVLLVPYEASHVLKYHDWMQDADIQEATASEPLSLEEEYENQVSWRVARDKLTFIVCEPVRALGDGESRSVKARGADSDEHMRGDVNFFLYPDEDAPEEEEGQWLVGEVDVMIAAKEHRGQGLGEGAVRALLTYIFRNRSAILDEFIGDEPGSRGTSVKLRGLMAKIKESNAGSRALFGKLGFRQKGEVNYFGEVTMVMEWQDAEALAETWMGKDRYLRNDTSSIYITPKCELQRSETYVSRSTVRQLTVARCERNKFPDL
ncbi:hypothetical protein HIM_05476 [Hirsutella minnesotensis 3608]|uniref:N-acetyltransferase domain-containing protein n=1 Tax=Hirsutella minnesotensis 3608 TaxID=1043627 RepID=A0A0F7ZP71_9HYPO|nr:hypothetical protein HIM_05476 [Hirsutella minnesotensis 3608]